MGKKNNLYIYYYIINYTYMAEFNKLSGEPRLFINDKDSGAESFGTSESSTGTKNSTEGKATEFHTFSPKTNFSLPSLPSFSSLSTPSLPNGSLKLSSHVLNTMVLLLAASSVTWVPLMVIGGKNKIKSKKINKVL